MIWTVCKISIQRLGNNAQELMLVFAVPVLFFSIFAMIFSRGVGQSVSAVAVSFIDDDQTAESAAIINAACQHAEINPITNVGRSSERWPIGDLSRLLISGHGVEVVVYIPAGFTTQDPDAPTLSVQLFNEGINPIGHRLVQASLAESIAMELAEVSMADARAVDPQRVASRADTPVQQASFRGDGDSGTSGLAIEQASADGLESTELPSEFTPTDEPQVFQTINAFGANKSQPKIAMYAAGIAVMFLLFSASGAGASLLEEREAGTLGRLLSSRLTLSSLLIGKWLYITVLGCLQLTVMFAWGQIVFGVDLVGHLPGFALMTLATAAACASFALVLAAVCRSRQQLQGVSIVLILTMSALGGSMVPRYIMSDGMRQLGKFTFNGWALDGFQKIFWYDLPITAIQTEVYVLLCIAIIMAVAARLLARRGWEMA